jgi:hypothetical protein
MPERIAIDVTAWKSEGKALWEHIPESGQLVFAWNNPWLRVTALGSITLAGSIALLIFGPGKAWWLALPVALCALFLLFKGLKFYILDRRAGGLHFFFSKEHFGMGGAHQRIAIPYSVIVMPEAIAPSTVNSNYIDLPVPAADCSKIMILSRDGGSKPWDGQPFEVAIASIEIADGKLVAKAYPNEFIVHIFSSLYPLIMYLSQDAPDTWKQLQEKKSSS